MAGEYFEALKKNLGEDEAVDVILGDELFAKSLEENLKIVVLGPLQKGDEEDVEVKRRFNSGLVGLGWVVAGQDGLGRIEVDGYNQERRNLDGTTEELLKIIQDDEKLIGMITDFAREVVNNPFAYRDNVR